MAARLSSKKAKKPVTKDDLRRLMKEQRNAATNRVKHPCAKYNSLDQLTCIVCNQVIKNEKLWNAHILGKTHKERLQGLKEGEQDTKQSDTAKRKGDQTPSGANKKHKGNGQNNANQGLPSDFFDSNPKPSTSGTGLGLGDYSSSDEEKDETKKTATSTTNSSLPPGFFDENQGKEAENTEKPSHTMAESLPEGFFDDPRQDAKVRQVEFRDKLDDEWELFQRAIKSEDTVSEAIIAEEDEQITDDKKLEEIDDQMLRWSKIQALAQKKEELMSTQPEKKKSEDGSDSEAEELELDEFLDWRCKEAWK